MTSMRFKAELVKRGHHLCFDLPPAVSGRLGHAGRVPVKGTINSFPVSTSVFPTEGGHFMMIGRDLQRIAGIKVGDVVRVSLQVDAAEEEVVVVPADLKAALSRSPGAKAVFDLLAHSHQHEYVAWIEEAKRPETRARRIVKTVERLGQAPQAEA